MLSAYFPGHAPATAKSPMHNEFWYHNMNDCPDTQLRDSVFHGLHYGVDIGSHGPDIGGVYPNWPSVYEHFDKVDKTIDEDLSRGRLVGPWTSPPCIGFVSSPLGAFVRHGGSGKVRVIHDLSFPPGRSVNDSINPDEFRLQYKSIDDAVCICMTYKEPCYLAKSDLRAAFKHVLVNPRFWHKLGFQWRDRFYASACLPFGLRASPFRFDEFARGLEYMAIKRGTSVGTLHYLDDTLTTGATPIECAHSIDVFNETARLAGFNLQTDKCTKPSQTIEFLGIQLDTVNGTLSIPEHKLVDTIELLESWLNRKRCTKRELLSIIGKLSFAARVIRAGRTFLRRLITLSTKVKYLHYKINLNKEAQKDLKWWYDCIRSHNGVSMFPQHWVTEECQLAFTDASDVGMGIVYNNMWTLVAFVGDKAWLRNMPIHFREMLAVCVALMTFGEQLRNQKVILKVDNMAIVYAINKGSIKCIETMELVRTLYHIMCKYDIECKSEYIATSDNVLADALSRLDFATFRQAHPNADRYMTCPGDVAYYDSLI